MRGWIGAMRGYLRDRYYLLVLSVWLVLFVEYLSRGDVPGTASWAVRQLPALFLNTLVASALLLILTAIVGRVAVAFWALAAIGIVLARVSGIKLRMLGLPLLPTDFLLAGETRTQAGFVQDLVGASLLVGAVVFVAVGIAVLRVARGSARLGGRERLALGVAAGLLLPTLAVSGPAGPAGLLRVTPLPWNQRQNVRSNGFLLAALFNVRELPSALAVRALPAGAKPAERQRGPTLARPDAEHPNIVIVLSESLWDPTRIPGISFNKDPMPVFHSLQKRYPNGYMLSPRYGGLTANVEFEVLTGLSTRFLPDGATLYNQYLERPIDSLASILARQGYAAVSIMPWDNWFFGANRAYRNMGFARFITIEFMKPTYNGPYLADSEVARVIMNESLRYPGPKLIYASTAENHFHYEPNKFAENTIRVTGIDGYPRGMLETYAQGVSNADRMLKTLVDHFTSLGEPTILVFFGDHLPHLGDDYLTYRTAGYITGEKDPDFLEKMYRVPVLVWNNYLPTRQDALDFSPSFLSPYLLHLAGVPGTPFTDFLHDLGQRIPVIPPRDLWTAKNINAADLEPYAERQRDILTGEQNTYGALRDQIVDPDFVLGYGPLRIDQVSPDKIAFSGRERAQITLRGQHFPPTAVLYAGGQPVPTNWESERTLTASIPSSLRGAEPITLEVRVVDPKQGTVLAQSNAVSITVGD